MLVDFYEITMANGFFENGRGNQTAYFDMFFRKVPDNAGYAIMAGVQQIIEYIENLNFTKEDIEYLRKKNIFSEKFLEYLENFEFQCDIWAVPEGTPIFPNEPLITVRGPAIQAQFIETMVLLTVNHQSLIALHFHRSQNTGGFFRPYLEGTWRCDTAGICRHSCHTICLYI